MRRFIFLLMLLLIPVASAVQVYTGNDTAGVTIDYPKIVTLPAGEDFNFTFIAFAKDTTILDTDQLCGIYIKDTTGNIVTWGPTEYGPPYQFINIGGGNFTLGTYQWDAFCYDTTSNGNGLVSGIFEVTYSGETSNTSTSLIYIALMGILVILLVLILALAGRLPANDERDDEGQLLSINRLKHFRPVLWGLAYVLTMSLMFIASNVAFAYLTSEMMGKFFFALYIIMFRLLLPMFAVWLIWIFFGIIRDNKLEKEYLRENSI